MRWTSEGLMVCACDTSGTKRNETIVVFDGNESSSLFMRFVSCTSTDTPTGERVTLASSFFFVLCFLCNMESISCPPHKGRRRPESVGGERVTSFDIGPPPPPRMNVGGYMPRYTSTTNISHHTNVPFHRVLLCST